MKSEAPSVSLIVVSYNTSDLLRKCLQSVYANPPSGELEVFAVDNASRDDSVEMVRNEFPQVRLIANELNMGFAAANNQAYAEAKGDYVVLLNPDALLLSDSLDRAVSFMEEHPNCALCGGKIVNPDGTLEPSARRFDTPFYKFLRLSGLIEKIPGLKDNDYSDFAHDTPLKVDWVPGTFTCYRRSVLDELGFFDERFYLYSEELDLCLRVNRAGLDVYFIPDAAVTHIGGACSKTRDDEEFDIGGSQVLKFRVRAESLFYRKNYGLCAVIRAMGGELGWHAFRWLLNLLLMRPAKRRYSAVIVRQVTAALRDTRFGKVCPPKPW